jgi:hypothetical protein
MTADDKTRRWAARPIQAGLIRAFVFTVPIAGSVLFLHFAGRLVPVPTDSFWLFITWWLVMSGSATVVLVVIDRVARRLLPLAALFKLSLVFPDAAPSRFRAALRSNTVKTLEQRVARARAENDRSTPVEAAERLLALVAELDAHDRLTRGHAERVRAYAQLIAAELRMSPQDRDLLNWAALLHDIGKLNVPSEILTKSGRPTEKEWSVLQRHPEFGMALVTPLRGWLGDWSAAVAQHHERWDGNGYPTGLSGDRIALAARIVAVADVFDVITSARSYKSASASTTARDEIASCAGTQFDPRVVRAFLNVSLGRLRLVMGPLSWLAHAPLLGRLPLTPAIGTAAASLATITAAVTTGLAGPPDPVLASTLPTKAVEEPATRPAIERVTQEDHSLVVGVEEAAGGAAKAMSLVVLGEPEVGRARVTEDRQLVYSPPPNFNGVVSVVYQACWSGQSCGTGVVEITVTPVNDSPIARDDTASTRRGAAVTIDALANDSDPDGDRLSIKTVSGSRDLGRARVAGRRIFWTPRRGFVGRAMLGYTATDGHGGVGRASVTIRVRRSATRATTPTKGTAGTPAPDTGSAPSSDQPRDPFLPLPPPGTNNPPRAVGDRVSVPEGGTVIIDVLANDSDPDGDPLSISSIGAPERGAVKKVGDRIQFSAPSNYVGDVSFAYSISDPSDATDRSRVSVSVLLVNAPPTFRTGPDQTVLEDAGVQRVPGWAKDIEPGGSSEAGQVVSFLVSADRTELFSAQPEVLPSGTLTFTPAANANGVAKVTVRARDNGGTANGGRDTSAGEVFSIAVKPVNDPPSFAAGADQSVPEDAGAQAVPRWATNVDPGPPNESGQTVSFVVTNGRPALFTEGGQPKVHEDGSLTYTPAANVNGSATVTVRAKDDGGTANGGDNTSPARPFTITVGPVNDPPSFTVGPDQTDLEDAGLQTLTAWATDISPGPPDESGQQVSFVVSNDNAALFGTQPAVAPNGTLSYQPAPNAHGTASVTVRARDDGGGADTSPPETFTITVTPVNDPPIANPDSATVGESDAGGATFNVLSNDTDIDSGDVLSLSSHDDSTISNGTLTSNGGGSFTYVPDPGFSGTETFTYVVADSSGATASASVTITVTSVPNSPVAGSDAYLTPQDTSLTVAAPGVLANDGDADGDTLTVQTSPVTGPANGSVILSPDGAFTYTPNSGFTGTDSFTYRIDDGTGRTADGVVTITVTSGAVSSATLYFQPGDPALDLWNMTTVPAPPALQLADFDGDAKPGLTIKNSDGAETETDGKKFQIWTYTAPGSLLLNGPVTLDLWSSTGLFLSSKPGTLYAYLYDCAPGGASCTNIGSNVVAHDPWNTSLLDWTHRQITVGSVSRTIPAGNELHVKLLFHPSDLWITMSASYPTALVVTLG